MRIGFISLGCPKNLVDSEVMMGLLEARGHQLTQEPDEAEALVVNTCSFIEPAQQESVNTILEMARYKTEGRARRLVVTGCLVERYRTELRDQIPEIDAVLGTNEIESIVSHCEGDAETQASAPPGGYLYHDLTPPAAGNAKALRVPQDQRRLRPPVHLLHHSATAGQLSQPPLRVRGERGREPVQTGVRGS